MKTYFSPEKSLFSLHIVRWYAGISAFIAIGIFTAIAFNMRDYQFDFSGEGFNKFAEFYKVPTAFLAIGFTLVGLCAANHRSEQTKKQIERTASQIELTNYQIELTKSQNNFSNYYKHIDEFEKYFIENNHGQGINLKFSRSLHGKIFNEARKGNYAIDEDYIVKFENFLVSIMNLSSGLKSEDEWHAAVHAIECRMTEYLKYTKISSGVRAIYVKKIFDRGYITLIGWSMREFISNILGATKTIDAILKFDPQYRSPKIVADFIGMDINLVPSEPLGDDNFYPVYLHRIIHEGKNHPRSADYSVEDITTDTPQ